MSRKRVYFDHAATTPVLPEVREAMLPYLAGADGLFGNPSSLHDHGRRTRDAVETAREQVAQFMGAKPGEIVFGAGATELNNQILTGLALRELAEGGNRRRILVNPIEHESVLEPLAQLKPLGFSVEHLPIDEHGRVTIDGLAERLDEQVLLVAIQAANNEIGTLQPVAEAAKLCRDTQTWLHVDAVQWAGKLPLDCHGWGATSVTISGHKVYGPKGIGALYVHESRIPPVLIHGGGQEKGYRSGTENVAGIVGLGAALEIAGERLESRRAHLESLAAQLRSRLDELTYGMIYNNPQTDCLPGLVNVGFEATNGESLLRSLDLEGFSLSSGSACHSGAGGPSHVLIELGRVRMIAEGSLRFTFGEGNTADEVEALLGILPELVERSREEEMAEDDEDEVAHG